MSGDYSRFTDRPLRRYTGVRMQQGRVQLDADWNEEVALLKRRWETQAEDTFGPSAVPQTTTPDGFLVNLQAPNDLSLGEGRIYVHGRLAEIFPGEMVKEGTAEHPVSYLHQPFLPNPPALPGGSYVVYLDVWDREVTYIEDPEILEKALGGPDTATRIQTVWQVKVQGTTGGASCGTAVGEPASSGRLSTRAIAPPASDDPCVLSPTGGYRGLENRLYRVEIHDNAGSGGAARFKWSRENASVASAVTNATVTATESQLTVTRIGRDAVLRFAIDDWVEVLDDHRELKGQPGQMLRVKNFFEATRTLILDGVISGFGATPADLAARHTRVRRWDQRNGIDANGLLTVTAGTWIALEDGVEVQLSPAGGTYHTGDFWSFAARTVDGSVEELKAAAPLGIHHVYCQLAAVNGTNVDDCRPKWPPEAGEGRCCCCTIEVGDGKESHGDFDNLLDAVEELSKAQHSQVPAVICLLPGTHSLSGTVTIARHFLTIRGCGRLAPVIGPNQGAAFELLGNHLRVENVFLTTLAPSDAAILCSGEVAVLDGNEIETPDTPAVVSWGCRGLWILGNQMRHLPQTNPGTGTGGSGLVAGGDITLFSINNVPGAVLQGQAESGLILLESGTAEARILGNVVGPGRSHGIALATASQRDLVIAANEIRGMLGCGIASVAGQATLQWDDQVFISHVVLWTDQSVGTVNDFGSLPPRVALPAPGRVDGLQIEHNTITACLGSALTERDDDAPYGGILLAQVDHVQISGNRIEDNGTDPQMVVPVAGIYILNCRGLVVRDNVILGNGPEPEQEEGERIPGLQGGILAEELSVRVEEIGAAGERASAVQPDGWPAASIQNNLVVAPRGLALVLSGVGPMQVTGNRLTSRDVLFGEEGASSLYDLFGAVAIINGGFPAHISRQILPFFSFAPAKMMSSGFTPTGADTDLASTLDPNPFVAGGKVDFSNNQVHLDLIRKEFEFAFAATAIFTLDDLSLQDNQTECSLFLDVMLIDTFAFATTFRATGNGFHESLLGCVFSLLAFGLLMGTATSNQGTYCINAYVLDQPFTKLISRDNIVLIELLLDRKFCRGFRLPGLKGPGPSEEEE